MSASRGRSSFPAGRMTSCQPSMPIWPRACRSANCERTRRRFWNRALNRLALQHLAWADLEVEAKGKNLAVADLVGEMAPV